MSMSQEEIEALMNGLDIADDENEPEPSTSEDTAVSTDEIDQLISQTVAADIVDVKTTEVEPVIEKILEPEPVIEKVSKPEPVIETIPEYEETVSEEVSIDVPELNVSENETLGNDDIDDLLKDLENDSSAEESFDIDNFDDILADVDSIVEPAASKINNEDTKISDKDKNDIARDWTDTKINEGVFPLPAEDDTKVVNQLSQVANDSEEKVGQIFDVLSLALDNNNDFRNQIKEIETFLESQSNLLNSLHSKFPNINVFEQNLNNIESVNTKLENLTGSINDEDMKIFEAMELMQFNDINRQKIERVMSVIRKLSLYLNNLFEDDSNQADIAVARHIHGDETSDLVGDDLEKLIEEFGN